MPARWHMLDFIPAEAQWCLTRASQRDPNTPRLSIFGRGREDYENTIADAEQKGIQIWIATAGFRTGTGVRRRQADMHSAQALILDIDVGEGKGHPDAASAAREIVARIGAGEMLKPTALVSSGYGLHLWYRLQTPLPIHEWRPLASAWKGYHSGFERLATDTTRWADGGLLRPFGTTNRKNDTTRPVRVLAEGSDYPVDFIRNWLAAKGQVLKPPARRKSSSAQSAPVSFLSDRPSVVDVVKGCPLLRYYHKTLQPVASEPAWWAALAVAAFTREGVRAAHALSVGYPRYSPEETEQKYAHIESATREAGPPGCGVLRERIHGSDTIKGSPCEACPMACPRRAGKLVPNPFNRLRIADEKEEPPVITVQQHGPVRFRDTVGSADDVEAVRTAEVAIPDFILDPDSVPNSPVLFDDDSNTLFMDGLAIATPAWWVSARGGTGLEATVEIASYKDTRQGRKVVYSTVSPSAFADPVSLCKALAQIHITVPADLKARKNLFAYALSALKAVPLSPYHSVMGYSESDGVFAVGTVGVDESGILSPVRLSGDAAQEAAKYSSRGTLTRALAHLRVYGKCGTNLSRFVVGLGFASPLMHLTSSSGSIVHLFGPGASGKTSLLAFITGLYGQPDRSQISGAARDTEKAVASKIAARRHLPVCYDEITGIETEEIGALAFAFTQGRINAGRRREGTLRREAPAWSTLMLTTGNSSLQRRFNTISDAADAQRRRIFEINITETLHVRDLQAVRRLGEENYGVLGIAWIQHIMRHRERLRSDTAKTLRELMKSPCHRPELELYTHVAAVNLVALRELTALGWWRCEATPEDIVHEAWAGAVAAYDAATVDPLPFVAAYITENITSIITCTEGHPAPLLMPHQRGIMGRVDQYKDGSRRVSLPLHSMRAYFYNRFGRQSSFDDFLRKLIHDDKLPFVKGPDPGRPWCVRIDMLANANVNIGVPLPAEVECLVFRTPPRTSGNVLNFSTLKKTDRTPKSDSPTSSSAS